MSQSPLTSAEASPAPFRFHRDPLALAAFFLYLTNRWLFKPLGIGGAFTHDYLNDVLTLPIFLPLILALQHRLGLRPRTHPPRLWELLHNWAVFSLLFEVILPRLPGFRTTADPWDVAAYLVGGLAAYLWWRREKRLDLPILATSIASTCKPSRVSVISPF